MSQLIERAARGIMSGASGGDAQSKRQDERGGELIRQLATGGLALGGGVGAAVVLANYLKSMRQEEDVEDESRLNDDTLYIPEHKKKASDVNRWLAPGLAVTGGVLSAGAAYTATQMIYNLLQKKHREKLLDEAQGDALLAADMETEKSAANMTFSDLATAFPVAVPLLAALASGGVAYAALNKTFPVVQPPKSKYPKRIRQVTAGGSVELPDEEELAAVKAASFEDIRADEDCEAAGMEFLTMLTDRLAMEKGATCITSDILNRVAKDGAASSIRALQDHGLATLSEIVKGASFAPVGQGEKAMAAALIFKSARLAPVVATLAASEMFDMLPNLSQICKSLGEETMDKMAGAASLMHMSWFRPEIVKAAADMDQGHPLLRALMLAITGSNESQPPDPSREAISGEEEDRDAAMTSDVSGSMGEDNEGTGTHRANDNNESQGDDDVVDSFMTDPKSSPPPQG